MSEPTSNPAVKRQYGGEFLASDAVTLTKKVRTDAAQQQLERELDIYIPIAFAKIRAAARRGEGEVDFLLPRECPMPVQIGVMKHLIACGYTVHPDIAGGLVVWLRPFSHQSE